MLIVRTSDVMAHKHIYLAPVAILAALMLISPVAAGQAAAYGVLAFAGYRAAKYVLRRGGRR